MIICLLSQALSGLILEKIYFSQNRNCSSMNPLSVSLRQALEVSEVKKYLPLSFLGKLIHYTTRKALTPLDYIKILSHT